MESLPQEMTKEKGKSNRAPAAASFPFYCLLFAFSFGLTGCVSTGWFSGSSDKLPTGNVCQVVATWQHQVAVTADPAHGGAPTPGIAGRLYLFGPEIDFPLIGDGTATVDLYDDSSKAAGKKPVLLEEWRIDADTLKRLLRRDTIGWGYTLFLPWGTYRPDITQVHLALRYEPAKGTPLYAPNSSLSLDHSACAGLAGPKTPETAPASNGHATAMPSTAGQVSRPSAAGPSRNVSGG